ncbi:separin-like [Pollicipes pollicipes]|uniref:separin-like n=1 Tax=Pollicipes pollicipes TaxID=41117 RepID=UPI001884A58E|nr:separin-like [Pollicipes pollicipes]
MVGQLARGPACRLPSLAILGLCLAGRRAQLPRPPGGATYIINPAGDLVNTEQRMGPFLAERGWSGIVGRPPTLKEFAAALTDGQILAYCGHGCGSQYLPAEKLRSLTCNAVALLFGCSSGQLVQPGPTVDPYGAVYAYLMANCPAILGNLWSVTDNMLDTYSKAVIDKWTGAGDNPSLPEAVSAARGSVSSTFMAAAPVVYGLPVTPDAALDRTTPDPAASDGEERATPDLATLGGEVLAAAGQGHVTVPPGESGEPLDGGGRDGSAGSKRTTRDKVSAQRDGSSGRARARQAKPPPPAALAAGRGRTRRSARET